MTQAAQSLSEGSVVQVAQRARAAARALARLSAESRNHVLLAAAKAIEENRDQILDANERDCRAAEQAVAAGSMSSAMFARLRVNERGVAQMATQVREVAGLPDP